MDVPCIQELLLACAVTGCVCLAIAYIFKPSLYVMTYVRFTRWSAGVNRHVSKVAGVHWVYSERGHRMPGISTIVLVHGFSSSGDMWNFVIKRLPHPLHIIAVDLPGHGNTDPDPDNDMTKPYEYYVTNLRKLLTNLGLDESDIHLVGHSMGGTIAGLYAATYPSHVHLVTLMCPAMKTPVASKITLDQQAFTPSQAQPSLIAETIDSQILSLKYIMYKQMRFPKQFFKGALEFRAKHRPFFKKLHREILKPHNIGVLNKVMGNITAPAHILWGEEDYIVDISGVEVLKSALCDIQQTDVIPKCGHAMDIEVPRIVAQKIMTFRDTKTDLKIN